MVIHNSTQWIHIQSIKELELYKSTSDDLTDIKISISVFRIGVRHGWAIGQQILDMFPNIIEIIADAGEYQGVAFEAIVQGFKHIHFIGNSNCRESLEKLGKIYDAKIIDNMT